jgi:hypothetical protein
MTRIIVLSRSPGGIHDRYPFMNISAYYDSLFAT